MALVDPLRYDRPEDVVMRLKNTIVFYKKQPVFCTPEMDDRGRNRTLNVVIQSLFTGAVDKIHSSDEDLDLQAKPLGFVNLDGRAEYYMRTPSRRPIEALHAGSVMIYHLNGDIEQARLNDLRIPQFGHSLLNEYPMFQRAVTDVETGVARACAFHRKLAVRSVGRMIKLYYFTNCVGVYSRERQEFAIPARLAYYTSMLRGLGVACFDGGMG